ncbi:MAG: sigma-54-dependent transcriptional regulator [Pirellulaceae bacterium]
MSREILLIADAAATGQRYRRLLSTGGYDVQLHEDLATGIEAAKMGRYLAIVLSQSQPGWRPLDFLRQVKITDVMTRCVIISSQATVETAVLAMREGAADYLREPCSADELYAVLEQLEPTGHGCSHDDSAKLPVFQGLIGRCPAMRKLFTLIERIAPAEATVLVTGESGTGKEMVVRAIHRLSHRRDHPFLGCDCTALAPTLLESELFGHVRGSFSGAIATKKGLFEAAHQGTLLLDEVANLSMETQGKLLRVLETRQVRKVGDTAEHEVDIRLIATTNRSLGDMVKVGSFRADLYYRLNVVPITLPPLRERTVDIPLLADTFLEWFSQHMNLEVKGFAPEAMHQMLVYGWPGNVRELRNIVERLSVLYGGTQIQLHQLPSEIREAKATVTSTELPRTWEEFKRLKRQIIDDLERRFLFAALDRCSHNVTQAAESVGMQRPNFHALLRHHDVKPGAPLHD